MGTTVDNVTCTYSGEVRYSISFITPNVSFISINSMSGEITLTLDAIDVPVDDYTVSLRCYDINDPTNDDLSFLRVSRVEENEFSPSFLQTSPLLVSVSESRDFTIDPIIVDINATDSDLGMFGSIAFAAEGNIPDPFSLDSSSGVVALRSSLDFESDSLYQFIVTASNPPDNGVVRSAEILVIVSVTDVNDEPPIFTEANYQSTVPETYVEGDILRPSPGFLIVECNDEDTLQADITYIISPGTDPGPFALDTTSGSFSVTEDLDYETLTSYSFSVMCFDNGSPANLSAFALVDITISSVNEFEPVIVDEGRGTLFVTEAAPLGTILISTDPGAGALFGTYEVTDQDDGPDGTVIFTLDEFEDATFFSIDPTTGSLAIAQELDVDGINTGFLSLNVRITPCDSDPPRDTCTNLLKQILVFSANEFFPMLSPESYDVTLSELHMTSVTDSIVQASCVDEDTGAGAFLRFQYANPTQDLINTFQLDGTTGEIFLMASLDYERTQSYGFELQCLDNVGNADTKVVLFTILPQNDNDPQFERSSYTFQVSRTTPSNRYRVGTVVAFDEDIDVGGDIQYTIDTNGYFDIDSDGGIELFNTVQNYSDSNSILLMVHASDGFTNNTAAVLIQLTEGNYNRPTFVSGSRAVQVSELSPVGTRIINAFCNDSDSGVNAQITYYIIGGNPDGTFEINSATGEITVANVLVLPQNSSNEEYVLEVLCEDGGIPIKSDNANIFVTVYKDDSSPPEIRNDTIFAFISEDAEINDVVVTIEAMDLDTDRLRFRLENESVPNVFEIDPSTGVVFVATALDRESVNVYVMIVIVSEEREPGQIGPERSDNGTLTIFIRDVNDNTPMCANIPSVTIEETLNPGSSIVQLDCSDPDFGDNSVISYNLTNDYNVLAISNQGEITLAKPLNFTDLNTLVVSVQVADQGLPQQKDTYQVTIFISSSNRHIPTFTNLPLTIEVSEAQPIQEVIFTVHAADPDRGNFGQVTYTIVNSGDNEPFSIFPNSGGIILTQKLNFFEQQNYSLNVSASDSDYTVSEELMVQVLDANEHTPQCVSTFISTSIPEGLDSNQLLSEQLSCSDDDEGSNGDIIYNIVTGNVGNAFEVLTDGSLMTLETLDFEITERYELTIQVSDSGTPPFAINTTAVIIIQAVNEFFPTFAEESYVAAISEGSELGRSILDITATDGDRSSHPDGIVRYSILGLPQPFFSISNTGILQVAGNLDREEEDYYNLTIQASDQGQPPRIDTATVEIIITDLDDSPPVFSETLYVAVVNRTESGTPVLTVNCTDPDLGVNGEVEYSLDGEAEEFEIQSSGLIQLKVDLPTSETYTFTAVCTGLGPGNFSDTAVVSIQVLVEGEIRFIPSSSYSTSIPEDTTPVFSVLHINASSSTGAVLSYTLLNTGTPFSINEGNGNLRLVASLDYESTQSYALQVRASDGGAPPNIGEAVVQILVVNVNDEEPQITTPPVTVTLPEGPTPVPMTIGIYECTDGDDGILGQIQFSIASGNTEGIFTVSQTGTLQLTGDLDYERSQFYSLELVCEDGGDPSRMDSITVPVTISPVNDNPPEFPEEAIEISVTEALLLNADIGPPIQATDADLAPHSSIRYSIVFGNELETFAISSTTGQLTLVQSLDYEDIRSFTLNIIAKDSGGQVNPDFVVLNDTITVTISVVDFNDNEPQFTQEIYTGTIEESASINDQVLLDNTISCTDEDSGTNGQISLHHLGDSPFAIQNTGLVTVQEGLDFEIQRSYQITLECRDGGDDPQLASQATIIISVLDFNEFGPVFNRSLYRFEVPETTTIGTEIGKILAVDQDAGEAGSVTYRFTNATDGLFSLDSSTGAITLLGSLDYETQLRLYVFEAAANDSAGLDDFTTVVIEVVNEDDNLPVFTQHNYFASIPENADAGATVGQVSCSDADDEADGSAVSYAFAMTSVPFQITDGRITVAGDLDLEVTPRYILGITCSDSAGNSVTASITVDLEPFNDFTPVFTGDVPYATDLAENPTIGLSIFQVTATDDDIIQYNDITFTFTSGNEEGRFEISPTSGVVTVNKSIDREDESMYVLNVQAQNVISTGDTSGSESLSDTTTLTITILDINDNDPTIIPSEVSIFVPEANSSGIVVQVFMCSDPDLGVSGLTNFSITSENTADKFAILEDGTLVTTDLITTNVVVEITCSDNGNPQRSTTATVIVQTMSMNDHPPQFDSSFSTIGVPENQPVGEDIHCLTATDMDGSDTPDGTIRYSLETEYLGSDSISRFSIRENTGCVFVSIALDFSLSGFYRYTVVATDSGDTPLSATLTLIIAILDVIEDPPTFEGDPYTRVVSEGVESGTFITTTTCTDSDDGDTVSYAITSGNDDGIFIINNNTGIIQIAPNRRLDYETTTSHNLLVRCIDSYDLTDTANVFVTVTPINEFTPSFRAQNVPVPEHSIAGTLVTQLESTDADDGPDGEVTFNITSGNTGNVFLITSDGRILVVGTINRESLDTYRLEIQITDQAEEESERRSNTNFVNITVTDINDHAPEFNLDLYVFGPLEGNESPGHYIGVLYCDDVDTGPNGQVTYELMEGSEALFSIDSNSGVLTLSGDLDTREFDNITFIATCEDAGSIPMTGTARVLISVVELNRHPPQFIGAPYQASVPEDTNILDDIILSVHADDDDSGVNGQVHYSLLYDYDNVFYIDEDTGDLSLLKSLDFETITEYLLMVQAIDGARDSPTRMSSTANITITVTGINEFDPFCINRIYLTIINATTISDVIGLDCMDDDSGDDGNLVYNITSGNDPDLFDVTTTGVIFIPTSIIPDESNEQYVLDVTVSDTGSPPRQTEVMVILVYSFENTAPPEFNQPEYYLTVSELANVGYIVATFEAIDPDPSLQGQVRYSISGTENFRIDPISGSLFVARPLDYESTSLEVFIITAQDSDPYSPQSSSSSVNITVLNENDNSPRCDQIFYSVEIPSTAEIDDTVLTLNCSDPDGDGLTFDLSTTTSSFGVSSTGRVYVDGTLTPPSSTILKVSISDGGGNTAEITISIQVRFDNNEPPVFTRNEYTFNASEATSLLSPIGSILATDADSSGLTYSIVDPERNPEFYVNPSTGEVLLTVSLDFETKQDYTFTVRVEDADIFDRSNQLSGTATVLVNVLNSNDNLPMLSDGGIYGATISKDTPPGTEIVTFRCTDADASPFGAPTVAETSFADTPFELRSSGDDYAVQVSQTLQELEEHIINITCTDEGSLSSEGQIIIIVPEADAPEFTSSMYKWILSESAPAGSEFRNISTTGDATYAITDGNNDRIFYIHPTTGVMSLVGSLDYETQQIHALIIRAMDNENRQTSVLLVVQVLDENDQVPLTPPSAHIEVIQNTPVGYPIGTLQCSDGDTLPEGTMFNFTFRPSSTLFSVDENGIVRLEDVLDATPVYVLPVICYDTSMPESLSTGVVTIEVSFVNQNPPVFEFQNYIFSVREDADIRSDVGTVQALDNDVGGFGELTYSITEGNPDKFYIDTETGLIGLLTPLDRETTESYLLTVVSTDGGLSASDSARMTGTTMVSIVVLDANDNIPMSDRSFYIQSIAINHTIFSPVLSVECTDPDLSEAGDVRYSLEPNIEHFAIQANGTIILTREQSEESVYNFHVVCTDGGDPILSSSALVTVTVDIAELTAPTFDMDHYEVTISEEASVASTIIQVHATPSDSSIEVVYNIESGNEGSHFQIASVTGDIVIVSSLDASQQQLYTLTIKATNTGRSPLSSFTTVSIIITDVNNHSPRFTSSLYQLRINESTAVLTPVIQVECTDADLNTDISYEIITDPLFNITQEGLITVAGEIDYETETVHTLQVTCSDGGGDTPMSAETTVTIEILPLNEFLPTFLEPVYQFTVPENSFGILLGTVQAEDQDAGSQGEITYNLQDPGDVSVVFVEPSTGDILVTNNLDHEIQTLWNLTVIARDGAGAESHVFLEITVTNVNDVTPVISPPTAITTIPHDSPTGFPLQQYTCTDGDGSETIISVRGGNSLGYFEFNPFNQLVWSGVATDLTSDAVVSLTIECRDSDALEQRALAYIAVTVRVGDVTPPIFDMELYQMDVDENTEIGTTILVVMATGENTVEYDLFNLPAEFPFSIANTTGEVSVTSSLNREMTLLYVFTVRATDTVNGALGLALIEITIGDINDNMPEILPSLQAITLPENLAQPTQLISFACSDEDVGSNGEIDFNITTGNDMDTFSISSDGIVELVKPLDFETDSTYNLTIVCFDGGNPPLSASATLLVAVTGVNEYPPQFNRSAYFFTVQERAPAGEFVDTVSASDTDAGSDGSIRYEIVSGTGLGFFSANSDGEIRTTTQSLNATVHPVLDIVVRAADGGVLSNDVLVTIDILDVNESPLFSSSSYLASTATNQSAGTSILDFICYDTDVGNNSLLSLEIAMNPNDLDVYLETEGGNGIIAASIVMNSTLTAGSYELVLRCSDHGEPPLHRDASVTVRVEGINAPPVFSHGSVAISVSEDTDPGTLLTTVNATDEESGLDITYEITGGNGLGTFSIDSTTGSIILLLSLDYETTPDYVITITVYDNFVFNSQSSSIQVFIYVINTNDLPPILSPTGTQVIIDVVSENTVPVHDINTYTCSDPDGGDITFSIDPPHGPDSPFGITATGTVQLLDPVDYEVVPVYSLIVVCSDMAVGETPLHASSLLIIHITPVNNYDPVFVSQNVYETPEDANIGDIIATVQATDQDNRGEITYSSSSHTNVFVIDQFSGNITLIQELDYEMTQEYILTIEASDNDIVQGVEPRTGTTMITIMVTDVNDNRPVCTSNLHNVDLETGTYNYIPLLRLFCSDEDNGMNRLLTYSFVDSTLPSIPNGNLLLNRTTGELGFTGTILVTETIFLAITVSDTGEEPMSIQVTVTIQVESGEVTEPRFEPNRFNITVPENTPSGSTILQGSILRDALYNPMVADVEYTLRANIEYGSTFLIDFASGDITVSSTTLIDFDEGLKEYSLVVEATVGDDTATAVVRVLLTDYNDNAPAFEEGIYEASIPENQPNQTLVLQVQANDIDSGMNGQFQYSIEGNSPDFSIDSTSGEIYSLRSLDREIAPSYSIFILAIDSGSPQLSGKVLVTITIQDENDVPPQFVETLYTISINNLSPPGMELVTFEVRDDDVTGSFTFRIITDNPEVRDLFTIDSPEGILRQRSISIPDDHAIQYQFTVEVNDEIATDITTVVIYIFSVTSVTKFIVENFEGETFDVQDFLLLQGFNITSSATYTINAGDEHNEFLFDSEGILRTQAALDRENIPVYMLDITVSDTNTSENVNVFIEVIVLDQNDNAPVFSLPLFLLSITEDTYQDRTFIGTVNATDIDEPGSANSRIEYSLIPVLNGIPQEFSIDPLSGDVFVQGQLDRESTHNYTLRVRARDFGGPTPEAGYANIVIQIEDVNDNDPRFVPFDVLEFTVYVPNRETPDGTTLNMITAILPGGFEVSLAEFQYDDPDTTSEVTASLSVIQGVNKYQLSSIDGNPLRQILVTTATVTQDDNGTVLVIVLRDQPIDDEDSSVSKTVTIIVSNDTTIVETPLTTPVSTEPVTPPTEGVDTNSPDDNFFESEIGIAVIIVISLLIIALLFFICCLCCYCYLRVQREKDPLKNR